MVFAVVFIFIFWENFRLTLIEFEYNFEILKRYKFCVFDFWNKTNSNGEKTLFEIDMINSATFECLFLNSEHLLKNNGYNLDM